MPLESGKAGGQCLGKAQAEQGEQVAGASKSGPREGASRGRKEEGGERGACEDLFCTLRLFFGAAPLIRWSR